MAPHGRPRGAVTDASPEDRGDLLPGDGGRPEAPAQPDRRRGLDDLAATLEGFNSTLATMNSKLDMLIAEREPSNGPVAKRVSCCPPLCSFLSSLLMMLFSFSSAQVQ